MKRPAMIIDQVLQDPLGQHMPASKAVQDVLEEGRLALLKHGPPTVNLNRAVNILTEELGEVAERVIAITSTSPHVRGELPDCALYEMLRMELCQLAAYALLTIQNLDSGRVRQAND